MTSATQPLPPLSGAEDMEQLRQQIMLAQTGNGDVARAISQARFRPRQAAFTSLLQFVSKAKQPDKALEIFYAMRDRKDVKPNTFSYSALVSALARAGRWKEAETFFNELRGLAEEDEHCKPNTVTYAAMISAYEKGRQYERALALFHEQLENNVDPDAITFASLLNACDRAGVCEKAVDLIEKMHSLGIAGPPGMYNTVIASCSSHWEHSLRVFLSMQCAGVDVSSQTVNLLLPSLCAGGQRDHALWLLRETINLGWPLSLAAYTSLLQLLSDRGDWVWASIVFSRMQMVGGGWIDANVAQALIRAHTNGGEHEGAARWATYFSAIGIHHAKTTDGLQHVARADGEHGHDQDGSKDRVEHVPDGQGLLSDGNPG